MDEAKIALSVPQESSDISNETPPGLKVGEDYKEYAGLYDLFNVVQKSPKSDAIMEKIWEWGKANSIGKDKDTITFEIIRLKNRLGGSNTGEVPWAKVLNYVTIWKRMREDEQTLQKLEK